MAKARPSFAEACARYVHRFTLEHVPAWARKPLKPGQFYAPQYRSDREWYESTRFPGEAHLSPRSRYCESRAQTWPLGRWLGAPYQPGRDPVPFNGEG